MLNSWQVPEIKKKNNEQLIHTPRTLHEQMNPKEPFKKPRTTILNSWQILKENNKE